MILSLRILRAAALYGYHGPVRWVLLALIGRCDSRGVCYPSVATIANEAGLSVRATRNALRALQRDRRIAVKAGGGATSSVYTVDPELWTAMQDADSGTRCRGNPGTNGRGPRHQTSQTPARGADEVSQGRDTEKSSSRSFFADLGGLSIQRAMRGVSIDGEWQDLADTFDPKAVLAAASNLPEKDRWPSRVRRLLEAEADGLDLTSRPSAEEIASLLRQIPPPGPTAP